MARITDRNFKFDWVCIILYFLLVSFGWLNILSASNTGEITSYFDFSQPFGKQLVFIILSIILIVLILSIEVKFYERFSSLIYIVSIITLLGLFVIGKNVNGATSWYAIGSFTIQPSEFAKFATALAVAKYLSDLQTSIKNFTHQLILFAVIIIPAFLILLQNDAGSTIVYASFFFVFYREGLPKIYLYILVSLVIASVITLKFGVLVVAIASTILIFLINYLILKKKVRNKVVKSILLSLTFLVLSFGVKFFYGNMLKPHQQDRISLWLRLEKDPDRIIEMRRNILYNLHESEKAISSGGFFGRGFLEGTRTTGKFVPEQHTDYIFSTVGEEWGFLGSVIVIILFLILLLRILHLAELQKTQFSRVYGYSVASILFIHFFINIGMVMGLIPTIGIPLPFFSYGGSALWGFTILLFIFIKLDSNRINEW